MLTPNDHVVVVGTGLAGWKFAHHIRELGFAGMLTMVGEESQRPYDRPPLSKQVLLGKWNLEELALATPEEWDQLSAEWIMGDAATHLDVAAKSVTLASGRKVSGTHVVIATGVRARSLPVSAQHHVFSLRTWNDSRAIEHRLGELPPGAHLVVIGGGFIGAEAATSLTKRGFRVSVLESAPAPLLGPLGPEVAQWLFDLPSEFGVDLHTNVLVRDVVEGRDQVVIESNEESLSASAVIIGVGAEPNVTWLRSSGLDVSNGVRVDASFAATEGIFAIGDVASFPFRDAAGEDLARIEHWQVANDQARSLASQLMGHFDVTPLIPYFWSDQYGKKIQMLGHPRRDDDVRMVKGSVDERQWLALYARQGVVTGVVALSQPRALMRSKMLLETPHTMSEAESLAPWAN